MWVELDVVFPQIGESFSEVGKQISLMLRLDDYIIDVDVDVATDLAGKAFLHAPLIGGSSVQEAEGHGGVAEATEWHDEGHLFFVFLCLLDPVVAATSIQ
jgi:hypothetical protein